MRLSTFDKPRVIACGEDLHRRVALPRGCLGEVLALMDGHGIKPILRDERFAGMPIEAEFHGTLRTTQEEAVVKVPSHDECMVGPYIFSLRQRPWRPQ